VLGAQLLGIIAAKEPSPVAWPQTSGQGDPLQAWAEGRQNGVTESQVPGPV
jgi:hypothetical protein